MKKLLLSLFFATVLFSCTKNDDAVPAPVITGIETSGSLSESSLQIPVDQPLVFTVKSDNSEGLSYSWLVDGEEKGAASSFSFTASERGSYRVEVVLTNAAGTQTKQEAGVVQVVAALPVFSELTCNGETLSDGGSLAVTLTPGGGDTLRFTALCTGVVENGYSWTVSDTAVTGNTTDTLTLVPTTAGSVVVSVTAANEDLFTAAVSVTVEMKGAFADGGVLFYGTTTPALSFYSYAGSFYPSELYSTVNGTSVGVGGVNDVCYYGGKLYLMTPNSASERAQVVICDASTLKNEAIITAQNFNTTMLGDIYNLLVVNENKAYIGYNAAGNMSGIRVLDMENKTLSEAIEGTSGALGVDGPCWSRMLRVGDKAFAGCGSKLQVIDGTTDQVVKTIEIDPDCQVSDIVLGRDGNVYMLLAGKADKSSSAWLWSPVLTTASQVVAIDPETLSVISQTDILVDNNRVDIGSGLSGSRSCASLTSDDIFFATGGYGPFTIYRYDYSTGTTSLFVTSGDVTGVNTVVNGYLGTDRDGRLYIPTTDYFSSKIAVFDIATGKQLEDIYTVTGDGNVTSTDRFGE